LPIIANTSILNAIQREVDKGKTEAEAIDLIENATMQYAAEFIDEVKFADKAQKWYDGGGYLAENLKPTKKEKYYGVN